MLYFFHPAQAIPTSAITHRNAVTTVNTVTTRVSDHPHSSK